MNNDHTDKSVLIISHTEHFRNTEGVIEGWIPTVNELDYLGDKFKKVIHLAVLWDTEITSGVKPYSNPNVRFERIPPFGGSGIIDKLRVLWVMPALLLKIARLMREVDYYQFRAPTSIGVFVVPFMLLFYPRRGWFKYAGSWKQMNSTFSYRLQRSLLNFQTKSNVTVNGQWPDQKEHVLTFENPCLYDAELPGFKASIEREETASEMIACFVGRLDVTKGMERIMDVLHLPGIEKTIKEFHFVGSSTRMEHYKSLGESSAVSCHFHGFLSRDETFEVYRTSHLIFLPSDTEGFPKVVAEAGAFGCVPVVSNVGSIAQYIDESNGYLWNIEGVDFVKFYKGLTFDKKELKVKSENIFKLAEKFTFEHFFSKLNFVLNRLK